MKLLNRIIKPIAARIAPRLDAAYELRTEWNKIIDVVQKDRANALREYIAAIAGLRDRNENEGNILDVICEGNVAFLANGQVRFSDRYSLWILMNEILINEDYYFETETDSPRIIDCGTHYGLAIYYFKTLYPKSRITGFEPVPEIREMALENIRRNRYEDVEVLPFALSDSPETKAFNISNTSSMASSLTKRRMVQGDNVKVIEVQCQTLSTYLRGPVHFLKLDIEGSEDIVLEEARHSLRNVQHLFCEYHHGNGLNTDRLAKILLLLDEEGFDTQVGKAHDFQRISMKRPMTYISCPYSAVIWAKNRNWE